MENGLRSLIVQGWRLKLEWEDRDEAERMGASSTIPTLRGAWGAALHDARPDWYRRLFRAESETGSVESSSRAEAGPRYVLRLATEQDQDATSVEFLAFGELDEDGRRAIGESWRLAGERGLGSRRAPFRLSRIEALTREGGPKEGADEDRDWTAAGFALAPLPWPIAGGDVASGCRIEFPVPVRMLEQGVLIESPGLPDFTIAMIRRARTLAGDHDAVESLWRGRHDWLKAAREVRCGRWTGSRLDLLRYSGSQRREIRMRGAQGGLDLPDGPGVLAPLLAAAQWTHLGKGTVMGLGRPWIRPLASTLNREEEEAEAGSAVRRTEE